jgi:hypothetical protein
VQMESRLIGSRRPIQNPRAQAKNDETTNSSRASHGKRFFGTGRMYDIDSNDDEGFDIRLLLSSASET